MTRKQLTDSEREHREANLRRLLMLRCSNFWWFLLFRMSLIIPPVAIVAAVLSKSQPITITDCALGVAVYLGASPLLWIEINERSQHLQKELDANCKQKRRTHPAFIAVFLVVIAVMALIVVAKQLNYLPLHSLQ